MRETAHTCFRAGLKVTEAAGTAPCLLSGGEAQRDGVFVVRDPVWAELKRSHGSCEGAAAGGGAGGGDDGWHVQPVKPKQANLSASHSSLLWSVAAFMCQTYMYLQCARVMCKDNFCLVKLSLYSSSLMRASVLLVKLIIIKAHQPACLRQRVASTKGWQGLNPVWDSIYFKKSYSD